MKKEVKIFIEDIKESIEKIEKYTNRMAKKDFLRDDKAQDSVMKRIEVIGEAVNNIPQEFRKKYHQIPWKDIVGMRNILIHEYFEINLERVWETVEEDLPILKKEILKILEQENEP
ncbi:DUF86 domain-containing protein [Patescibacteria group bacterium]|nr:DUF86 domain-containing protein [Patescibacteria group bacterium]MBU4512329.1 DUF86 domain-containing protein [Patescibacteria group bacterium]MCG2692549.1 DUF86 domain-containing protein [Candidatus Parcubacteria bacterium]